MKAPHVGFIFLVLVAMVFVISGIYEYALELFGMSISESPIWEVLVDTPEKDDLEKLIWE